MSSLLINAKTRSRDPPGKVTLADMSLLARQSAPGLPAGRDQSHLTQVAGSVAPDSLRPAELQLMLQTGDCQGSEFFSEGSTLIIGC